MFKKGDKVICINEKMDPIGSVLERGKTYTVKEYNSPEDCLKNFPSENWWQENAGKITLEEVLGADGLSLVWFGRRFKLV